ncbi:MAG: ATP-binding protein [Nostoc sp. DedQUE08]|uniref:tetratricopeptide repeat protein n=1 Tax=Nostoc sp. DedQUE08 TaxID=3075393 RepID=UPI002AD2786B|nr:ATP-binding protein [Nostoc sp. DedQUE08]MDZ8067891.1 ATP-binding protein [Nostoc sp. DedQUE08]
MNTQDKPKSLQDIVKQRQQSNFVGREDQINRFRQNLALPVEDNRHCFLFNVSGQGGVGKTTLLRQFRKIADEAKMISAYIDEAEKTIPEVMGRIAEELEQQGYKLTQFSDRYKVYCQKCQELETDPEAPQGFSAFVGKTMVKTGVHLARRVPVGGAVFDFVDENALATQAGEWASYVAKKITNKDEVHLVKEPKEVLTPLFLQDISKIADKTPVVLFFDTSERTGEFLENWLREIFENQHGKVSANILMIVASRQELDKNDWASYEGLIVRLPLEPFTEEEAKQYLIHKGITDNRIVEVILNASGNLPLLIEMLADAHPNHPNQVIEPSSSAVKNFLKWIDDPKRRQVVLDAAIPRCLNRDVIAKLRTEEEADELFSWLKETSFINERSNGWVYHDVVKTQMLCHKRLSSPQGWADIHGKLAQYYDSLRNDLQLDEDNKQRDPSWQSHTLNVLYHKLCQSPQRNLFVALNEFLALLKNQPTFAQQYAKTMLQAGKDGDSAEVQYWGKQLANGLKAYEEKRYEDARYNRALVYLALNQPHKAQTVLVPAIKLATEHCKKDAKDWRNTFNLALYYLAAQYTQQANDLYRYALSKGASSESIGKAIQDLNDFLIVFPDHLQATSIRQLLLFCLTKSCNLQPTLQKTHKSQQETANQFPLS